jgi:hypothetical protein
VMLLHRHLADEHPEQLTAFVADVDDKVLNAEFSAIAAVRTHRPGVSCERVLWRGADARGNAGRWLARLASGRWVLVQKLGRRWEWIEGTRDHTLACVPDQDFPSAMRIALLRDI